MIRKFCNSHSTIKDIIGNKFIDCWTPLDCLESAKDDKSLLIFRPTTLVDPDGDGPKLPDLPFILFMKLRNGRIELDLTNPLKCQRAAVEGHSLASIYNLTVVDRQILYTMIGTRKQFVFKAFNLGSTLGGKQSWMGGRIQDIAHSFRPLPGFNMKTFPYVIGLNSDETRILLMNIVSQKTTSLVTIAAKSDADTIDNLTVSFKT